MPTWRGVRSQQSEMTARPVRIARARRARPERLTARAARRALRLSPRDPFSAIFTGIAAYAQFAATHYDEAMRLAREAIRQRSDFVGAHRVLTAAAGMAGDNEAAVVALQELRRTQPKISLAWIADEMPIMQGGELEHYLEAFRRAGLD